ncbi:hypothetical protein VTN00DRAFT_4385 [Thermoascus crustaceus]|uniref:uncharacterized protein n=1 Tax=Thermoascus crustaceus TaxID=5088 RepID=UPI003743C429
MVSLPNDFQTVDRETQQFGTGWGEISGIKTGQESYSTFIFMKKMGFRLEVDLLRLSTHPTPIFSKH